MLYWQQPLLSRIPFMPKIASTTSKRSSTKRTAMRDIAVKPLKEQAFTVQPIVTKTLTPTENFEDTQEDLAIENTFENEMSFDQPLEETSVEEMVPEPEPEPQSIVKVKFAKFVQLVANHDFDEVLKNNPEEEVILSSNLLTELAGAHDEREGKKFPIIFLVGLAIGVVLTYILLNK